MTRNRHIDFTILGMLYFLSDIQYNYGICMEYVKLAQPSE